jgi:hypothetical protein
MIMRTITTILGVVAVLALAGFLAKGPHQKAAICDTAAVRLLSVHDSKPTEAY